MKNKKVIITSIIIAALLAGYIKGCAYLPITGTVVDAETGKPIEGAVVLVEWTIKKGIGDKHTESVKVAEVLTDKDGKFDLPGCYRPFVEAPDLTIYKRGHVAWNNKFIFPNYKERTDFKWENGYLFKLEEFIDAHFHNDHVSFLRSSIAASQNLEAKVTIYKAFEWERYLAQQERVKKGLSP